MAVLPKQSGKALPECYRYLMSDSESEIIDMYPSKLKIDTNMQTMAWLGVELIPYIELDRFKAALDKVECGGTKLNEEEKIRNRNNADVQVFFVHFKDLTHHKIISRMPYTEFNLLNLFPEYPPTIQKEELESIQV